MGKNALYKYPGRAKEAACSTGLILGHSSSSQPTSQRQEATALHSLARHSRLETKAGSTDSLVQISFKSVWPSLHMFSPPSGSPRTLTIELDTSQKDTALDILKTVPPNMAWTHPLLSGPTSTTLIKITGWLIARVSYFYSCPTLKSISPYSSQNDAGKTLDASITLRYRSQPPF